MNAMHGEVPMGTESGGQEARGQGRNDGRMGMPPSDAVLTVLLVDDSPTQSARIQDCLAVYRVCVEWRPSYRSAAELLRDPDAGQLIDLILIDQAFESAPAADLLTHSEIDALAGTEDWDVHLHQGLFIMARLSQDMREGRIPGAPMMILTHYARVKIAAQVGQIGLAGYESKRRLLSDPYASLKSYLPQMRPTGADVDRRLRTLATDIDLDPELADQLRQVILGGLDPDEVCAAVSRLPQPADWRLVGRALEQLAEERSAFPVERLAAALAAVWLPSPDGWLRICQIETLGPLGHGFEAFRAEIRRSEHAFSALLAVRPLLTSSAPAVADLRRGFGLVREIDPRSRPLRLRDRSWTILGAWLREPPPGISSGLLAAARHVQALHSRGLAHGSLTMLTTSFEPPIFGGIRWLAGEHDLERLRRDDRRRLAALALAAFDGQPLAGALGARPRWSDALGAGDLDLAVNLTGSARRRSGPPAYVDFGRVHSGEAVGFRDLLLTCLGSEDALLREVGGESASAPPLDFVVCVGGALTVLEHWARLRRVVLERGEIVEVEACPSRAEPPGPDPEPWRFERALARCRRSADVLAGRVEAGLGLPRDSVRRRAAIVVSGRTEVRSPGEDGWRAVMTEAEAIAELAQLSRAAGAPGGAHMLPFLPRPEPVRPGRAAGTRALHWTTVPLGVRMGVTMRTWSKRWPPESWRSLLSSLSAGSDALRDLPSGERPLPLLELRAYDGDGRPRDLESEAASVELVEYDVQVPADAAPLPTCSTDSRGEAGRRRLAVAVLHSLLRWERLRLAYCMEPGGLLHADGHVYCDLLQSVASADAEPWWRQRCSAASCLVLLLSPWPFAWPVALGGTMPAAPDQPNERSTWGIAATAVTALLDPDMDPGRLRMLLAETADLLEAAARLGHRFPSWPAGLTREALP
jgi:CheY-like chemotaxis protein